MAPASILVVITRRIGDVLLATPLIRSLKRAWPEAAIDALVFRGTAGVLAANPDVRRVLDIGERPTLGEHARLYASFFRRYDLALSLQSGDRPTLYARAAGRRAIGLQTPGAKHAWKKRLLTRWVAYDDLDTHAVRMNLALAAALDIEPHAEVVLAWSAADAQAVDAAMNAAGGPYAVLHAYPKFNYKKWTLEAWSELARWLAARGLRVVLTGGGDAEETAYVGALASRLDGALDLAGKLTLAQTACLLSRARLYCGPDTATTHMAAALGVPTVALFGPSNPVRWGPWPRGFSAAENPWHRVGTQHQGNVTLVQGEAACVPCLHEGCERHVASYSDCLQHLPARRVIAAAQSLLADVAPPL